MEKRHVQTFLTVSAAFFAMSLPVRQAQAGVVEAAVSRTIAQAGLGASPAEAWAVSMGGAPAARTPFAARPIAKASHVHASKIETASTKRHADASDDADVVPFTLM